MQNISTSLYKVLKLNKVAATSAYNRLKKLKGLWCDVKRPITSGTIFGLEDLVEYDPLVKTREQLLIFGIFQEGEQGMEGYDAFIDAYVLTLWKDKLPLQTLIEVDFCGRNMSFKVDTHRNVSPTVCEQLFIKNMLVAAT